jgi:hypothetical protein
MIDRQGHKGSVARRRGTRAAAGLAVTLGALLILLGAGTAVASGNGLAVHQRADAESSGADRWTPRQMRRAVPLELLQKSSGGRTDPYPKRGGKDGPPGYVDGRPPLGSAPTAARTAADAAGFGPFTSRAVSDPNLYPNTTNGKVFGRIPGIGAYTCSAAVVHSKNRSVIFTAGHCVKEPGRGGWAKKLTFVPSYDRGARPFGQWSWDVIYTGKQWAKKGNSNFDYAAVVLRKSGGRLAEDTVGSLGFAFNVPKRQTYRPVGYPFNKQDTEVMWECIAPYGGRDPFYRKPGPAPLGIGCNMLGGASGGGWMIAGNRLASVTSFGYDERKNELYGPRLNKKANKMRLAAGRQTVG